MVINELKPEMQPTTNGVDNRGLLLPDLVITGFRAFEHLELPRMGRVTLLTGENGVGKTTVLEALHIYALGGDYASISGLLRGRREFVDVGGEHDNPETAIDVAALYHGRRLTNEAKITIGSRKASNLLTIQVTSASDPQLGLFEAVDPEGEGQGDKLLQVLLGDQSRILPWTFAVTDGPIPVVDQPNSWYRQRRRAHPSFGEVRELTHISLMPGLPIERALASGWDAVALKPQEDDVVAALKLILRDEIDRIAFVGDPETTGHTQIRRCIVKLRTAPWPVPLQSLGDGVMRLLRISLALAVCRDGLLMIDEIENGFHYEIQPSLWQMIFRIAQQNNVQVIATTHSSDCVSAFAAAAVGNDEVDGELVRLNIHEGVLHADTYSEERVANASKFSIDLR